MLKKEEPLDQLVRVFPGIMHHFHNLSSAVSRMHDLTVAQYRLIQILSQKDQCTINELAMELGIAQSSASEQITRMVNAGLLRRIPSENDRRINYIALTNNSKDILLERAEATRNHIKHILDQLSKKQQHDFVTAFEKISSLLLTANESGSGKSRLHEK
ncbi:MAG: MarR family transcriptional regulator [Calditrichaeota bacterium]|nr:MAG: MarR family transcriptional regulator [Calditrichota bacterium]